MRSGARVTPEVVVAAAGGSIVVACRFQVRNLSFGIDNARSSNSQTRHLLSEHDHTPFSYPRASLRVQSSQYELEQEE
jgi:hypothetical protein